MFFADAQKAAGADHDVLLAVRALDHAFDITKLIASCVVQVNRKRLCPRNGSSHLRTSVGPRRLLFRSCLMAFSHGLDTHLGLALRLIRHDLRLRALRDIIASLLSACMTVERKGNEVAVGFGGKLVVSSKRPAMRSAIIQATEDERDRIVALIERATETWVAETPSSEGWAAYVTALNAARRNVEEALRIIDDAHRT